MKLDEVAIVTLTRHGTLLGRDLSDKLQGSQLFSPSKFALEAGPQTHVYESVKETLQEVFPRYGGLVLFISTGAAVRMLAPLLKDKKTDPAVVIVDDRGTFSISLLSGHVGGANELALTVAQVLGATPVITTASDVNGTIPVDILGRDLGWTLELEENVTRVSAAVVSGEEVAFVQETGEPNWWTRDTTLPKNIARLKRLEEMDGKDYPAILLVTDRVFGPSWEPIRSKTVIYRPRSLSLGIGCDRGTTLEEIEELVLTTLSTHGLSPASMRDVATITLKRHEEGILGFAAKYHLPLKFFTQEELNSVDGIQNPSEVVYRYVRTYGVAEPSALRLSGAKELLIPKVKSKKATLAVARFVFDGGGTRNDVGES